MTMTKFYIDEHGTYLADYQIKTALYLICGFSIDLDKIDENLHRFAVKIQPCEPTVEELLGSGKFVFAVKRYYELQNAKYPGSLSLSQARDYINSLKEKEKRHKKCSDLEIGNHVVFKCDPYFEGKISYYEGNVICNSASSKKICVCFLSGYKSLTETIPYEDIVAVSDPNGEYHEFPGISGRGVLLIPE